MPKDYYIVLGVSRGADLNRIKRAYRRVVKKYHPDLSRTQETTQRFMEAREAYETLGDVDRRKRYDEDLAREESGLRIRPVHEVIRQRRSRFDEMERFSSRADDFFAGFLPGFFDVDRRGIREKDLYFEAVLTPREAAEGGLFPVTVPVIEPCPRCRSAGMWEEFFCPVCRGYGGVQSERDFSLSIPPNVKNGTEVTLSLEDIGLRDVYLHIVVHIDQYGEEEDW